MFKSSWAFCREIVARYKSAVWSTFCRWRSRMLSYFEIPWNLFFRFSTNRFFPFNSQSGGSEWKIKFMASKHTRVNLQVSQASSLNNVCHDYEIRLQAPHFPPRMSHLYKFSREKQKHEKFILSLGTLKCAFKERKESCLSCQNYLECFDRK